MLTTLLSAVLLVAPPPAGRAGGGRDFPRAAWKAFLRASRITLRKIECDEP